MFNDVLTGKASTEAPPPVPPTTSAPIPLHVILANQREASRLQAEIAERDRRERRNRWLLGLLAIVVVAIVRTVIWQAAHISDDRYSDQP
ncbi:MAG TPA: hypothetical protein VL326_23715 [Kofleriaceae bacterium]|jgi:beta-lactamase regulating signal transducer with metallopeptidase domain|nr:hypothetical protein [Kofleriaceae bacterium]